MIRIAKTLSPQRLVQRTLTLTGALCILVGCAADPSLGPQEKLPTAQDLASRLHLAANPAESAPHDAFGDKAWWTVYHDAELTAWIERGLRDSPDLRIAGARLQQAEAFVAATHAGEAPSLNFNAQSNAQRLSGNGIFPPPLGGEVATINDLDLVASLELDLFGRLAARTDAARLEAQAGAVDRDLAGVRLAGAIGHAYFELARAQQARRIAVQIETDRAKTLELVRDRVRAGLDTQVERRLAEVTLPEIRVDIERADEQIALARHALAVLAGQAPDAADAVEAHLPDDAALAPPAALPLDLLARRADVVAAQRRVAASLRSVDVARADFYPNVNLNALVGLDSLGARRLLQTNSRTWQVGPAVHLPIFQGGSLRAALRSASAQTDEAIDTYNATVLQAAREVADTSSSIAAVRRQRSQQELATANAQVAADLAVTRYRAGLGNFLTVLTAQGAVLSQRRSEVDLDARAAALDVSLALAMGGGFRDPQVSNTTASKE